MENFETLKFIDKDRRDLSFYKMRHESGWTPQERQAVKFSDAEPRMVSEEEFLLDDKGRIVYQTYYFIAYPKDIHGHRARKRAEHARENH